MNIDLPDPGPAQRARLAWQDAITTSTDIAAEVEKLEADFRERELVYGDRLLCTVLRPRFLSTSELEYITAISEAVQSGIVAALSAIKAAPERYMAMLGEFSDLEADLIRLDYGLSRPDVSVRLDGFYVPGEGIRFVEVSGSLPSMDGYTEELGFAFADTDIFERFQREVGTVASIDISGPVTDSIWAAWTDYSGSAATPTIAVVDWLGGRWADESEFRVFRRRFEAVGMNAVIADPRELEFDGDRLLHAGKPIDIVFRRLIPQHILANPDDAAPLLDAAKANAVCMVNPLFNSVCDRKAIFALLTDPDLDFGMSRTIRKIIDLCVPWTRRVSDTKTTLPSGELGSLLDYCEANRDVLVLKPNYDFGGVDVRLGWHHTLAEWRTALETALSHDYVVQTKIAVPTEEFPTLEASPRPVERHLDTAPFMRSGRFGGILTRLSDNELSNVTAGGSAVPTFIVDGV